MDGLVLKLPVLERVAIFFAFQFEVFGRGRVKTLRKNKPGRGAPGVELVWKARHEKRSTINSNGGESIEDSEVQSYGEYRREVSMRGVRRDPYE
jgi:hypothetical protein